MTVPDEIERTEQVSPSVVEQVMRRMDEIHNQQRVAS